MANTCGLRMQVERVSLKPVRDEEGKSVVAVVTMSFPLDSDALAWLGIRVGSAIEVVFDEVQGELLLER